MKKLLILLILSLLFGYSFADLQITRTISNTVGYINKMFFTADGLSNGAIKVSIDGITGNINMSGDIRIGGQICLGGVCKSGFDSIWGENGTKIYYNAGNIGVGTNDPNAGVHIYKTSGGNAEIDLQSVAGAGNHWAMYHDATTNQFKIWKTVDRFFIGSGGNVGIGVNNPGAKLTIGQTTVDQNAAIRIDNGSVNWYQYSDAGGRLIIRSNNSGAFTIQDDGKFGVGTTSPENKFHVMVSDASATSHANSMATFERADNGYLQLLNPNNKWSGLLFGDPEQASAGAIYYDHSTDSMQLYTSAAPKITINSGGQMGIGTTNPGARLHIEGTNGDANGFIRLKDSSGYYRSIYMAGGDSSLYFNNGSTIGYLSAASNWVSASDRNYKKDIVDMNRYGLETIIKMRPVEYKMKSNNQQQIGFIAQEMEKILPEVVEGKEGQMGISYGNITSVLVKAVQELKQQNDELKKEIEVLKSK